MNAYELADYLQKAFYADEDIDKAANMLRQQADRIAELEKENSELKYEKSSGVYDAEPVAWIAYDEFGDFMLETTKEGNYPWQPLYTTPQTKPLSDEEILETVSAIEHEQWMAWANQLMHTETISESRATRWTGLMIPYAELSEEMKEHDRVWARKVIEAIEAKVRERNEVHIIKTIKGITPSQDQVFVDSSRR